MGFARHGSVRCVGISFPSGRGRRSRDQENVAPRDGQLVARWLQVSIKERTHEDEVPQGGQSCSRHGRQWQQSVTTLTEVRACESQILRQPFRPTMEAGESWVGYKKRTSQAPRDMWREMGLPTMAEKNKENCGER